LPRTRDIQANLTMSQPSTTNRDPERFRSASVLLRTDEYWILQHRDSKAGIAQPGAVGMWGGRATSAQETPQDNALRELEEETNILLPLERLESIREVTYSLGVVCLNNAVQIRKIEATIFLGYVPEIDEFRPNEGQAAIRLPLYQLFEPDPTSPLPSTVELGLAINGLAQLNHPIYLGALSYQEMNGKTA
jgi:8-oxo-dGTP pyrophosphatase MutT (NUDIX family)